MTNLTRSDGAAAFRSVRPALPLRKLIMPRRAGAIDALGWCTLGFILGVAVSIAVLMHGGAERRHVAEFPVATSPTTARLPAG